MPGVLLAFVFALGWMTLYWCRAESVGAALPFYDRTERPWVLASTAMLTLHVTAACVTLSLRSALPSWRGALGIGVFAAGIGFWLWGRMLIGPLRVTRLPDEPPRRLRRDGPFGLVRHPLYCGALVAAGAPVLMTGEVLLGFSFALCVAVLAVRSVQEERRLRAQLGAAYDAYCREVKRLVPFLW